MSEIADTLRRPYHMTQVAMDLGLAAVIRDTLGIADSPNDDYGDRDRSVPVP